MRCIICDRCKDIMDDPKQVRVITCSRPMKRPAPQEELRRSGNPPVQDIIWEKELCTKCAMELETLINNGNGEEGTV